LFNIAAGSRSAAVTWVPALTYMLVRMRVQAEVCRAGTLLALTHLHDSTVLTVFVHAFRFR
jgi:hypothetical protein